MSVNCVLHVGMHKCGSSAIQQALSLRPILGKESGNGRFVYAAITHYGGLLYGDTIIQEMTVRAQSYVASATWRNLVEFSNVQMEILRSRLQRICKAGDDSLILSNEGWGNQFAVFQRQQLLERLGLNCHVVLYVRPQVAWLNSAWWQWGAWGNMPLQRWVDTCRLDWHRVVEGWRNTPGVDKVTVRLLPSDIVTDFSRVIGAVPPPHAKQTNVSLPGSVLRVFQRHRHLRPDAHSSGIEFALARHLQLPKGNTPWVLPQRLISRVVRRCEGSNRLLMDQLDDVQKIMMRDDPAWWSADYYAGRRVESSRVQKAIDGEIDQMLAASFDALYKLDEQYRHLLSERVKPWWQRIPVREFSRFLFRGKL